MFSDIQLISLLEKKPISIADLIAIAIQQAVISSYALHSYVALQHSIVNNNKTAVITKQQ